MIRNCSATCVPTACSSEEEDRGTLWKTRVVLSLKAFSRLNNSSFFFLFCRAAANEEEVFIPHDVLYARPLAEERVNNWSPGWNEGGLAEEGKKGQDTVEGLEFLLPLWPDCHTLTEFRQDHQVQDNWAG